MDLHKLSIDFERIAHTPSEAGIARLISLGVEGLQVFLEAVSGPNTIDVEAVRNGYGAKGWSEYRWLSWLEVKSMVEFLDKDITFDKDEIAETQTFVEDEIADTHVDDDVADVHAVQLASLYDIICKRQASNEFPLVKPTDL